MYQGAVKRYASRQTRYLRNTHLETKSSSAFEKRMTRACTLHTALAKMMISPKPTVLNPTNPSFLTKFNRQGKKVKEHMVILDQALRCGYECSSSIATRSATLAPEFLSQFPSHLQLSAKIRKNAQKDARRTYASEMDEFLLKSAEDAFLDEFQIVIEAANGGLKNAILTSWNVC